MKAIGVHHKFCAISTASRAPGEIPEGIGQDAAVIQRDGDVEVTVLGHTETDRPKRPARDRSNNVVGFAPDLGFDRLDGCARTILNGQEIPRGKALQGNEENSRDRKARAPLDLPTRSIHLLLPFA